MCIPSSVTRLGYFLTVFVANSSNKSCPKIKRRFSYFENHIFLNRNVYVYVLGKFWRNLGYFYSTIWSHRSRLSIYPFLTFRLILLRQSLSKYSPNDDIKNLSLIVSENGSSKDNGFGMVWKKVIFNSSSIVVWADEKDVVVIVLHQRKSYVQEDVDWIGLVQAVSCYVDNISTKHLRQYCIVAGNISNSFHVTADPINSNALSTK